MKISIEFPLVNLNLPNHVTPSENIPASYNVYGKTNLYENQDAGHYPGLCRSHDGSLGTNVMITMSPKQICQENLILHTYHFIRAFVNSINLP